MTQTQTSGKKVHNKSQNKFITVTDLYLHYPHKTYDVMSNTVPKPYFSKKQITNNEYSLTYSQWIIIIWSYLKFVRKYLISGGRFYIPGKMGYLVMTKFKKKKNVDIQSTRRIYPNNVNLPKEEKKYVYYKNKHTEGHTPALRWRKRGTKFKNSRHWRFRFSRFSWKDVSKNLMNTPHLIHKYNDI